jgi:hypothetical protein
VNQYKRGGSKIGRFIDKVEFTPTCWYWHGSKVRGYGQIRNGKRRLLAHRFSYEYFIGPPKGVVHHKCERPNCVNPLHLEDTTQQDNVFMGDTARPNNRFK